MKGNVKQIIFLCQKSVFVPHGKGETTRELQIWPALGLVEGEDHLEGATKENTWIFIFRSSLSGA
jgi:hypothetical protein